MTAKPKILLLRLCAAVALAGTLALIRQAILGNTCVDWIGIALTAFVAGSLTLAFGCAFDRIVAIRNSRAL